MKMTKAREFPRRIKYDSSYANIFVSESVVLSNINFLREILFADGSAETTGRTSARTTEEASMAPNIISSPFNSGLVSTGVVPTNVTLPVEIVSISDKASNKSRETRSILNKGRSFRYEIFFRLTFYIYFLFIEHITLTCLFVESEFTSDHFYG